MRISQFLLAVCSSASIVHGVPVVSQSDKAVPTASPSLPRVEVHLAASEPGSTKIKVAVKNAGASTLHLFKQSDLLTKARVRKLDVFQNEQPVVFHGLRVHFDRQNLKDNDFEAVQPGKSIERVIDVAKSHDMSKGGDFVLSAKGFLEMMANKETRKPKKKGSREFGTPLFYKSNNITIHVEKATGEKAKRDVHRLYARMQLANDCSQQQNQVVQSAMSNCAQIASQAAQSAQQADQTFQAFFKTSDPSTAQNVASRLQAISQECSRQGSGITTLHCVDDSGDSNGCTDRAIAFTYGLTGPPDIYVCQSFYEFSATPQSCGVNDQATTIIHELAHNTQVFSPGCTDIPGGYGSQATLGMDGQTALQNADSYSFFSSFSVLGCQTPGGAGHGGDNSGVPTPGDPYSTGGQDPYAGGSFSGEDPSAGNSPYITSNDPYGNGDGQDPNSPYMTGGDQFGNGGDGGQFGSGDDFMSGGQFMDDGNDLSDGGMMGNPHGDEFSSWR